MKPKLRALNAQQTPEGIALSDPLGISTQVLLLSPETYYIATLFDGNRTLEDVQELLLTQHGSMVPREKLDELLKALEEARFLETDELLAEIESRKQELLSKPRPMVLAGISYPGEREAFEAYLKTAAAFAPEAPPAAGGLIMPHLEPARVPGLYGAAVTALKQAPAPERLLILGVAHQGLEEAAAALPTGLETPYGTLESDLEALQALDALLPYELFNSTLSFQNEHSIEFPAVFAHAAWPDRKVKVLPLLIDGDPTRKHVLDELATALSLLARDFPLYPLASVDLSHVGARFGHPPLDESLAARARNTDEGYLELLASGNFDAAWKHLMDSGNPTYVDAYAAVHAGSKLFAGQGKVVGYQLSPELAAMSAVGAGVVAFS
ncbi:AmmeMemoRadiSam system protein B [Oceanithermus sp.]